MSVPLFVLQGGSEANLSLSPVDSKSAELSPSSSVSSRHQSTEKQGSSESSSVVDKSFDDESETDEQMDSSYENATVTKFSANNLKLTFRKQKKPPKKKGSSGGGGSDTDAIAYSVQNHEHSRRSPKKGHSSSVKTEPVIVKEEISTTSSNGSTTSEKETVAKPEVKSHQRSDACVPFRKRKFKYIVDDASSMSSDLLDNRTPSICSSSSSIASTPVPLHPQENVPLVIKGEPSRPGKIFRGADYEDNSRSVFQFDNISSEDDRTNDNVFKVDKPIVIAKSDFEFENVSEDEDDEVHEDLLQDQMTNAINSILDLQRGPPPSRRMSMAAEADAMLKRQLSGDSAAGLGFTSALPSTMTSQSYEAEAAAAGLNVDSAYSSTAMPPFGDQGNAMAGLAYGSAFNIGEDSNLTQMVSPQEAFGAQQYAVAGVAVPAASDETSIVDDLQKELNMLQYSEQVDEATTTTPSEIDSLLGEGGNSDNQPRGPDPDLQEAVNSILF